jgi:hypothetical protein
MVWSGLVTASPRVAVKPGSGVADFAAEAAGVNCNHLVCRAGLSYDSLLLPAVGVVLFGLFGAALYSSSPGVLRISEAFP